MVAPSNRPRHFLSADEEAEIFSYVFADFLHREGFTSAVLRQRDRGQVDAHVVQGFELYEVYGADGGPAGADPAKTFVVGVRNGVPILAGPVAARAFIVRFSSFLGVLACYVEVSFSGGKPSLDTVIDVPRKWTPDRRDFPPSRAVNIVRVAECGHRALFVDDRYDVVQGIPEISERRSFSAKGRDPRTLYTPLAFGDYLRGIGFL